ncbi:MAG: YraN family protein [Candidatus Omnitrophica bacterium]|nr:YraN family protein [Candidatus Omnitrophota bacterium]
MSKQNLYLGKHGEEAAVSLLKENGYKILARNYKTKLGEIDIIATDKDTFCFIEVKARSTARFGSPQEAVSRFKQRQISKAALVFLKENNLLDKKARFDVVSVLYSQDSPKIDLIKNAFGLSEQFTY